MWHSVINPTNGKVITKIAEGTAKDLDTAVKAAHKAFDTVWGLHASGHERSRRLAKLGDLMEQYSETLAALEALDNGKSFSWAKRADVAHSIQCIRYYSGWADKITGQVIETSEAKLSYTRHEPIGVVGQIIPWNFPRMYFFVVDTFEPSLTSCRAVQMMAWKIGPALATGCAVILKPSEYTPLTALFMSKLIHDAGFPAGVFNLVNGYGQTVGQAISEHAGIEKVRADRPVMTCLAHVFVLTGRVHGQHARRSQDYGDSCQVELEEGHARARRQEPVDHLRRRGLGPGRQVGCVRYLVCRSAFFARP